MDNLNEEKLIVSVHNVRKGTHKHCDIRNATNETVMGTIGLTIDM